VSIAEIQPHSRRLLWITDIPTPYRIHFWNVAQNFLAEHRIDLQVVFMAHSKPYRKWTLDPSSMLFPNGVSRGIHLHLGLDRFVHFNPWPVARIFAKPPEWLVLGGTWWMPTSVASMAAAAMSPSCKVILHLEANRHSLRQTTGAIAAMRRAIFLRANAFLVPGQIAIETITDICGESQRPFLQLPNVVDDDVFGRRVAEARKRRSALRLRYGIEAGELALIWPARLEERYKGILRFLKTVRDAVPPHVRILIAGEGSDRRAIEEWIARNLPNNVVLLGHQMEDAMVELLASADALLLPSVSDANPLSVIEGLWAGLPLLISNRCGNSPEAVIPDRNGWVVDPDDPPGVRTAFRQLVRLPSAELVAMGAISREVAQQRFATRECAKTFISDLERL
jgi:glycosyltransferase involved in cell wall biosynthesis